MQRRTLLIRACQAIAATIVAVLLVPIGRFISAPLFRKKTESGGASRVAKLSQLKVGEPLQVPIIGSRRDGWTLYPQAVIGKVWLVRRESASEGTEQVDAYSAICPHLGCGINHSDDDNHFICPCHGATFDYEGEKIKTDSSGATNPSPRPMDKLNCQIVKGKSEDDQWVEVEYEQFKIRLKEKIPK